jgi:hypothetical protein
LNTFLEMPAIEIIGEWALPALAVRPVEQGNEARGKPMPLVATRAGSIRANGRGRIE